MFVKNYKKKKIISDFSIAFLTKLCYNNSVMCLKYGDKPVKIKGFFSVKNCLYVSTVNGVFDAVWFNEYYYYE